MNPDPSAFTGLEPGRRILLAFSGGIDSSAAAYICRKAGFEVLPVYLRLIDGHEGKEIRVRQVAEQLQLLPLQILDLRDEFKREVMAPCWREFAAGRTPNPCVLCNPQFKFGRLQQFAHAEGCCAMASGHYVNLFRGTDTETPQLFRGTDTAKDQSYFLYGLSDEQLRYSCFPLGGFLKSQVRELVRELGLPNASDPESQDICFAQGSLHTAEFLRQTFQAEIQPGRFRDMTGKILGSHAGIHTFTPGQRKGTGVAMGKPAYVQRVCAEAGDVFLTTENSDLMNDVLHVHGLRLRNRTLGHEFRAEVQIRYRGKPSPAVIRLTSGDTAEIRFDTPMRAITPGQAAVFYDGERQLGGGCIDL